MANIPNTPDTELDTWAADMVRGLPPIPYDEFLKISVYRAVFPWLPWSLRKAPAA
jgi:hypothetical protein